MSEVLESVPLTRKDFVSDQEVRWCPGCGDYAILAQMQRILPELGINKEEMHRPLKHIILSKKPVMIDFERSYKTKNPHNVTQFCTFLVNRKIASKKLFKLAKAYKQNKTKKSFAAILKL